MKIDQYEVGPELVIRLHTASTDFSAKLPNWPLASFRTNLGSILRGTVNLSCYRVQ